MPIVLRIILYPIFAFVCLVLFSVILFPFDSLKNRVAQEIEKGLGGQYSVTIGKLSPAPMTGLVLKDLTLQSVTSLQQPPSKISRLKLKFGLFALLRRALAVDFDLRTGSGRAQGSLAMVGGGTALDLSFKGFDLAAIPFAAERLGVPIGGEVSGTVFLELYPQDPLRNQGKIVLDLPRLELQEGSIRGTVAIPKVRLAGPAPEKSRIEVSVAKGNWEVGAIKLAGGDLECDADGKIYGARSFPNYRFNLKGSLKIVPELFQKFPLLGAIEKQKGPDGTFPFTVTGRFSKPSIRIGEFKVPI